MKIPEAKAALDKEWKGLWSLNTWLVETISECDEVRNKSSKKEEPSALGEFPPISTLKGSEWA